jgi:hypothetical protein
MCLPNYYDMCKGRTGIRSEERAAFMRGGPTDGVIVSGARVRGSVRLRLACIAVMLVPGRIVDNYSYGYTVGLFI